jgi:divalent metal cation (Fe/Co/Zn/Cd) transporter
MVVAVFVCLAGWRLARRTIKTLTDTAPAAIAEKISAAARGIPGVVAVERVRARPVGDKLFVDSPWWSAVHCRSTALPN